VKHGIKSPRLREPRAQEVADRLKGLPHVIEADELAAREVGRL
jgi:hypothetical protein